MRTGLGILVNRNCAHDFWCKKITESSKKLQEVQPKNVVLCTDSLTIFS